LAPRVVNTGASASLSVEGVGWSAVPDAAGLELALKHYRRAA